MRYALFAITLGSLAACTGTPPVDGGQAPDIPASCDPESVQEFLGQTAGVELGPQLLLDSGARQLRWVPPRSAVTLDFRADRLTVEYDDAMTITRLTCG